MKLSATWLFVCHLLVSGCSGASAPPGEGARPAAGDAIALPRISFSLDPSFPCRVSKADPQIVGYLRDAYGVEIVSSAEALLSPGPKVKYLPDAADPNDGLMQL